MAVSLGRPQLRSCCRKGLRRPVVHRPRAVVGVAEVGRDARDGPEDAHLREHRGREAEGRVVLLVGQVEVGE